jgi:hypothetical protein
MNVPCRREKVVQRKVSAVVAAPPVDQTRGFDLARHPRNTDAASVADAPEGGPDRSPGQRSTAPRATTAIRVERRLDLEQPGPRVPGVTIR